MTPETVSLLVFLTLFATLLLSQPMVMARARGMQYVMGNREGGNEDETPAIGRFGRTVNNTI